MLNKVSFLILSVVISFNSFAGTINQKEENKKMPVSLTAIGIKITEPFTSRGIAHFKVLNKTDQDIEITKITSAEARYIDFYTTTKNDFGAEQVKRTKNVFIKADEETLFDDEGVKVMMTGLKKKYLPGDEVVLKINYKHNGIDNFTVLPIKVYPDYK